MVLHQHGFGSREPTQCNLGSVFVDPDPHGSVFIYLAFLGPDLDWILIGNAYLGTGTYVL
jgi:hypothetical protein